MVRQKCSGIRRSYLEGAFRKLSDFSSDIAHELRTPVSNLMMQTQFALAKERDVSHYREILFANLEELKRLSRMTSDMLFLARSEHGLLRLDKHDVDLAAELNELRELFEPLADETGKTITVEGEGVVAGDSDMLRRAFSNLLSNAIKYSPDNTCTAGLAPIFPYTFYHLTHYWFAAADIPVANDTPVHYADAIRCNVRRPPQGSLPLLTRRVSA
ncbi:hypothetical protein WP8S18E06_03230 [Klebsiella sp. WP8-S18-ESBL-06]|nr:hypothetical protein WP8S18E06_03230 [Klebsiella sp. WP8-S18-ESBL-06]